MAFESVAAGLPGEPVPGRFPHPLRSLRHRNYRLFFVGQLISLCGTWMQSVAQGWLVLTLTNSPFYLGLVAAASSIPVIFLSLPAGVLADRVSKQRLLIATQTTAMLLALSLAALTASGTVQVWHVIVLAALLGVVNAFDAPARQAFTIEMVGRKDLLNAIALNSTIFNVARTLGPAIAGFVVAKFGEAQAFLLNGLSFIAVIAALALIDAVPRPRAAGAEAAGQLKEGVLYVWRDRRIRGLLLLGGGLSFFGFSFASLLPAFARDVFNADVRGLGYLLSGSGAGALLGAMLLAFSPGEMRRGRSILICAIIYPAVVILFGFVSDLSAGIALTTLTGFLGVTAMALSNTAIQTSVPDGMRARAMSFFTLILLGLLPLGSLLIGSVSTLVGGVRTAVVLFGAAAQIIVAGVFAFTPQIEEL